MPHSTTGSARSFGAFRFPYDKYEDEVALYENFRYLQEYLRFLGTGDKHGPDYIIGSTESSHNVTQAHYKCNGTNDNIVIQQAFDDAETDGSQLWIHILGGNYNIAATLSVPANVRLTGAGMGKTVLTATATSVTVLNIIHAGGGYAHISDLTVDGADLSGTRAFGWFQGASSPAQITMIERVRITRCGQNAAETSLFAGPNYIWFDHCVVDNNASSTATFRMRSVSLVALTNSLFLSNDGHVLSPSGSSNQPHLTSGNIVQGNGGLFIANHSNPVDNHNYKNSNTGDTDTDGGHSFESEEAIEDVVGGMVTGNTETGITVTYEDSDGTLDFVVDTEFISDTVGAMVTGNTETLITVTYEDTDNTLDFVVEDDLSLFDNTTSQFLATSAHDALDHTTAMSTVVLGDISDVGVGTPTAGNLLEGDGDSWESVAPGTLDAADFGSGTATVDFVLTADGAGGVSWEAAPGASGGMEDFLAAGDSGTPQTITDGNTLTIAGGTGIDTVAGATDTVTVAIDSTVATLTGAQTLTNKTINTASNDITIVEADISDLGAYLENVVEDTTPQLGGNLDAQLFNITDVTTLAAEAINLWNDTDNTPGGNIRASQTTTVERLTIEGGNGSDTDARIVVSGASDSILANGIFHRAETHQFYDLDGNLGFMVDTTPAALFADGAAATPSISFANDTDTGLFSTSANVLGVGLGANHRYQFTDAYFGGVVSGSIQIKAAASSTGAPGITFSGDSDTGIHSAGSGQIQLIGNASTNAAFTTTATSFQTGTTGSAANLRQASTGAAVDRSTSALRFKSELEDADWLADIELRPMKFYREDDERYFYGFIADWLADQDDLFGEYHEGEIDNYNDRAVLAVLAAKVNRLEQENNTLKAIIEGL